MRIAISILGWFACLFITAGLLKPALLAFRTSPLSMDESIADTAVSWAITLTVWSAWIYLSGRK